MRVYSETLDDSSVESLLRQNYRIHNLHKFTARPVRGGDLHH